MKKSELKEYIKQRIKELVVMDVPEDPSQLDPTKMRNYIQQSKSKERDTKIGSKDKPVQFIEEIDLNEMARQASIVKIDPDIREKAKEIKTGGPDSPAK
jgi:hypothetical protein